MSERNWKVYVLTTNTKNGHLIDLRMESLYIVNEIVAKLDFVSSNGDQYDFKPKIDDLFDMKHRFSVFIEGKISEHHRPSIHQAIVYTWNLTAYQTKNFVNYFNKNYQFVFLPNNQIEVDMEGNMQTKITYFIISNGRLAKHEDFDLLPRVNWLQDSMQKFDLPYYLLDGNDESIKAYNKLYYIDFDGYIDPSYEENISAIILTSFRKIYSGNSNYKILHSLSIILLTLTFTQMCNLLV